MLDKEQVGDAERSLYVYFVRTCYSCGSEGSSERIHIEGRWLEASGVTRRFILMGGRAFLQDLPPGSLPRLPTSLYVSLKARLTAPLLTLFAIVEVPPEKPEKEDHGDIDFVVACPLSHKVVTPEQVGRVLGAVKSIELDGNRTSNYAVNIDQEEWLVHSVQPAPSDRIYCQVDVKVCGDEEEAGRMMVFHGYGDLGIIIGAIAKSHGLSVNPHGLKVIVVLAHYGRKFSVE